MEEKDGIIPLCSRSRTSLRKRRRRRRNGKNEQLQQMLNTPFHSILNFIVSCAPHDCRFSRSGAAQRLRPRVLLRWVFRDREAEESSVFGLCFPEPIKCCHDVSSSDVDRSGKRASDAHRRNKQNALNIFLIHLLTKSMNL